MADNAQQTEPNWNGCVDVPTAARMLAMSERQVYRLCREKRPGRPCVRSRRTSKKLEIPLDDVQLLQEACGVTPHSPRENAAAGSAANTGEVPAQHQTGPTPPLSRVELPGPESGGSAALLTEYPSAGERRQPASREPDPVANRRGAAPAGSAAPQYLPAATPSIYLHVRDLDGNLLRSCTPEMFAQLVAEARAPQDFSIDVANGDGVPIRRVSLSLYEPGQSRAPAASLQQPAAAALPVQGPQPVATFQPAYGPPSPTVEILKILAPHVAPALVKMLTRQQPIGELLGALNQLHKLQSRVAAGDGADDEYAEPEAPATAGDLLLQWLADPNVKRAGIGLLERLATSPPRAAQAAVEAAADGNGSGVPQSYAELITAIGAIYEQGHGAQESAQWLMDNVDAETLGAVLNAGDVQHATWADAFARSRGNTQDAKTWLTNLLAAVRQSAAQH